MMWVTEPDAHCSYLNRAWYEFTGQTEEEAAGFGWLEAVHPEDRGWSGETFLAANARREAFRLEYRLRRSDGAYRWAIDAASPRFGPSGEFLGFTGSVVDIHDRKVAEELLQQRVKEALAQRREADALYRTYFENTPEALFIIGVEPDGGFRRRGDQSRPRGGRRAEARGDSRQGSRTSCPGPSSNGSSRPIGMSFGRA